MPHFFFHTRDGEPLTDEVGSECRNLDDAQRAAVALASSMVRDNPDLVLEHQQFTVDVVDASGSVVFQVAITALSRGTLQ
jgi:hypothetical protein